MRMVIVALVYWLFFCSAGFAYHYVLSSTPDGTGKIFVDDDIRVLLKTEHATVVLVDDEDRQSSSISPIAFYAQTGDELFVTAVDYPRLSEVEGKRVRSKGHKELSPLYLVNTDTGRSICIFAGFPRHSSNWYVSGNEGGSETQTVTRAFGEEVEEAIGPPDVFVQLKYTIGTVMQLYCLSSSPNSCEPLMFSDSFPLFKLSSDDFLLELHPDDDADTSTYMLLKVSVPLDLSNVVVEYRFSNSCGDAYAGPMYMVPFSNIGKSIPLMESKVEIDGECESFLTCPESVFYSYNGTLSGDFDGYQGNEEFLVEYRSISDWERYGFGIDVTLLKDAPVPMYMYFSSGGRNVFWTPSGVSYVGEPIYVDRSFSAEYVLPRDMAYVDNLFVAGNYTFSVSDINGRYKYYNNFVVGDLYGNSTFVDGGLPSDCGYLDREIEGSLQDERFRISDSVKSACFNGFRPLDRLFTFSYPETENTTVTCSVYSVRGLDGFVSDGLYVKASGRFDFDAYFVLFVECASLSTTDNETEQKAVDPPEFAFEFRYSLDSSSWIKISGLSDNLYSFDGDGSCSEGKFYVIPFSITGIFSPRELFYSMQLLFTVETMGKNEVVVGNTGIFSHVFYPVKYVLDSAPEYDGGVRIDFVALEGGHMAAHLNFGVTIDSFEDEVVDPNDFTVWVEVYDDNKTTVIPMTYNGQGFFESVEPFVVAGNSTHIYYRFGVRNVKGELVTGNLLSDVFSLSVSMENYPLVLAVEGKRELVLGDSVRFRFYARSGYYFRDFPVEVYVGLYRKGRGVVWLTTGVQGAWVPVTSVEKKPLFVGLSLKDFRKGASLSLPIDLPSKASVDGLLYPGEYTWILEVKPVTEGSQDMSSVCSVLGFRILPE